jgi:prepilin-type processing-associated H-X9-DG protein
MKQVGLAVVMYTQDYDESYPLALALNNATGPLTVSTRFRLRAQTWASLILPYARNLQIFACPSRRQSQLLDGRPVEGGQLGYVGTFSCRRGNPCWDGVFFEAIPGDTNRACMDGGRPLTQAEVRNPSGTIMLWDVQNPDWYGIPACWFQDDFYNRAPYMFRDRKDVMDFRHLGRTSIAYTDGHARTLSVDQIRLADFTATADD